MRSDETATRPFPLRRSFDPGALSGPLGRQPRHRNLGHGLPLQTVSGNGQPVVVPLRIDPHIAQPSGRQLVHSFCGRPIINAQVCAGQPVVVTVTPSLSAIGYPMGSGGRR
jgi:hypothetical protein